MIDTPALPRFYPWQDCRRPGAFSAGARDPGDMRRERETTMRHTMTTKRDLRNWVDDVTSGWAERSDEDVDTITDAIRHADHPAWGTDWSEFLGALPELTDYLSPAE